MSSSLSTRQHLPCCLFLPSGLITSLLPSLLPLPLCQQPSVISSAFLLSFTAVPSSVPIAAALIQVLITSCLDSCSNLPNGLSSSLKSVIHIKLICLKYSFHHVRTLLKTSQLLLYSLQNKVHSHARCGLCDIISHYSFRVPSASTKSNYFFFIHSFTDSLGIY